MHQLTQWQQTGTFDPYNPNQIIREPRNTYPGQPGGYGSFFFNKVPTTVTEVLSGLRGSAGTSFVQILIVGGLATAIGWWGLHFVGPKIGLKSKGVSGLAGRRRR